MNFSGYMFKLVMLASMFSCSCNSTNSTSSNSNDTSLKSASIVVSELNDVCDFVQAFEVCISESLEIHAGKKYEQLVAADQKKINQIGVIMDAIISRGEEKKLNLDEALRCGNWVSVMRKGKQLLQLRKSSADLHLNTLHSACDHLKIMESTADSINAILHGRQINQMSLTEIKLLIHTSTKITEIINHSKMIGLDPNEFKACENFEIVNDKLMVLNDLQ